MMKPMLTLLLLTVTLTPIASVSVPDITNDPRYIQAKTFRDEARADWAEAKAELVAARQAYTDCIASGDPPDVELTPIAQQV